MWSDDAYRKMEKEYTTNATEQSTASATGGGHDTSGELTGLEVST